VAASASVVGAGGLAAAAMAPNAPQAVTVPIGPDPIHEVIEQHRKACLEHTEAVSIKFAFEDGSGTDGGAAPVVAAFYRYRILVG
jgi:hypothetical protein